MLATEHGSESRSRVTLTCFRVHGDLYAVDTAQLREVVRYELPVPLPNAPALIEGVIDLRGSVIPVVDLGSALGLGPIAPGPRARICIAEADGLVLGLAVEFAEQVMSLDASRLEDPPALATQAGYDAARAIVRRPGDTPIPLLAIEHLLERVYRSALDDSRGAA